MKELSIFIDESGDFGEYTHHSPFYNAMLPRIEFRKVLPSDYKLFQVSDLLCSFYLINLKLEHGYGLSHSELMFFGNIRDLKKNYLKPLNKKEWC